MLGREHRDALAARLAPFALVPSVDAVRGGEERVGEGPHFLRREEGFGGVRVDPSVGSGERVRPNGDGFARNVRNESPRILLVFDPGVVAAAEHGRSGGQGVPVERGGQDGVDGSPEEAIDVREEVIGKRVEHGGDSQVRGCEDRSDPYIGIVTQVSRTRKRVARIFRRKKYL